MRNSPKKAKRKLRPNSGFPCITLQPQSASSTVRVIGGALLGISAVDQAFNRRQLPGSFRQVGVKVLKRRKGIVCLGFAMAFRPQKLQVVGHKVVHLCDTLWENQTLPFQPGEELLQTSLLSLTCSRLYCKIF